MHVRKADGSYGAVESVTTETSPREMYNLTVDAAHTYFVGDGQWLVHNACKPYQVDLSDELNSNSEIGDNLDIHHGPQKQPASQILPNYNPNRAPAITLPNGEHMSMNNTNLTGQYTGTARDLLAKTIWDLRNTTGAPNSSLWDLIKQNKITYPTAY